MQLYLKTHSKTGMKYFGYSKNAEKRNYRGDSALWSRHLKEHGYDFKTELLFESEDEQLLTHMAVGYSIANQIWCNPEYANQQLENARPGNTTKRFWSKEFHESMCGENHAFYGKHHTEESNQKRSEALKGENSPMFGIPKSEETCQKISDANKGGQMGENNHMYGGTHTPEARQKISDANKGKHTGKDNNFYGEEHTPESKQKISDARKGKGKGKNNSNSKPVIIDDVDYDSMTAALIEISIGRVKMKHRLESPDFPNYKYNTRTKNE